MIRLLPIVLIIVLIVGGLGYWRFIYLPKTNLTTSSQDAETEAMNEVPATLPQESLEDSTSNPVELPSAKSTSDKTSISTQDKRIAKLEAAVIALKANVAALQNATPSPTSNSSSQSNQSTEYIPLGSGGSWSNVAWTNLAEYQISLNPANFPGYTGMNLEVTFRINDSIGLGSVQLYDVTDNIVIASQVNTTSSLFTLQTSQTFTLPSGSKTYTLQTQSGGNTLFIQSARIRVNY